KQDFTVRNDLPLKQFYEINTLTYARQGVKCPFSFEDFERIEAAAAARNQSRRYAICDKEGRVHSVTYVICSGDVWHSIFAGSDPELRSSNAATLLLWHILCDAHSQGCKEYNFNGSVMRSIETFIRHFGAEQTPYMMIEKHYSKLYSFLKRLKH
ncbi:MAG: GNAT family N-acetyltransferase, partial [Candidatus Onthomorpha sp.]|nr:GNAT family N-acetyltransferase [Candidatus Onthomorpha sp.]